MVAIAADKMTGPAPGVPTRRVASDGMVGTVSVLLVWLYNTYVSPEHPMPAEIASTVTTVLTFLVSYFMPPASGEAGLPG